MATSSMSYNYSSSSTSTRSSADSNNENKKPGMAAAAAGDDDSLTCLECGQAITSGRVMKAGGRAWHDEHFNCSDCGMRLTDVKVYQKDGGKLYCDSDYKRRFVPVCAFCSAYVTSVIILWLLFLSIRLKKQVDEVVKGTFVWSIVFGMSLSIQKSAALWRVHISDDRVNIFQNPEG